MASGRPREAAVAPADLDVALDRALAAGLAVVDRGPPPHHRLARGDRLDVEAAQAERLPPVPGAADPQAQRAVAVGPEHEVGRRRHPQEPPQRGLAHRLAPQPLAPPPGRPGGHRGRQRGVGLGRRRRRPRPLAQGARPARGARAVARSAHRSGSAATSPVSNRTISYSACSSSGAASPYQSPRPSASATAPRRRRRAAVEHRPRGGVELDARVVLAAHQVDVVDPEIGGDGVGARRPLRPLPLEHLGRPASQAVARREERRAVGPGGGELGAEAAGALEVGQPRPPLVGDAAEARRRRGQRRRRIGPAEHGEPGDDLGDLGAVGGHGDAGGAVSR